MWVTFWPDVLVAVIGAVLTVAIAFVTYALNVRRNELLALRSLIFDLAHRRAFSGSPGSIPGAAETGDYARANASVLAARDEIRHARRQIRQLPSLQRPLSRMVRACNVYLEAVETDPGSYATGLVYLRDELDEEIRKLACQRRHLSATTPGADAL